MLCQNDPVKGNSVKNFRPITCHPIMWKLVIVIISEDTVSWKTKTYFQRSKKAQLLIDKPILKDCRKRRINLAMVWRNYRKAYHFVPDSWILECIDTLGIADNISSFLEKSMKKCKLLLNSNESDLC